LTDIQKKAAGFDLSKLESADLKEAFVAFIHAKKEYEIVREQEQTKRQAIDADLKKYLTKVELTQQFLTSHLTEQYAVRRETIDKLFDRLDRELENNNDAVAIHLLTTLEGIVKENPLREIDLIGKAFASGSDLEI